MPLRRSFLILDTFFVASIISRMFVLIAVSSSRLLSYRRPFNLVGYIASMRLLKANSRLAGLR